MRAEVERLLDRGVSREFLLKLGLEYRYLSQYLLGRWTYDQMVDELGRAIKRFAKRQMTWFRRDARIHWLNMAEDPVSEASELISGFLNGIRPAGNGIFCAQSAQNDTK